MTATDFFTPSQTMPRTSFHPALLIGVGIIFGWVAAHAPDPAPIAAEEWHGNVRASVSYN